MLQHVDYMMCETELFYVTTLSTPKIIKWYNQQDNTFMNHQDTTYYIVTSINSYTVIISVRVFMTFLQY